MKAMVMSLVLMVSSLANAAYSVDVSVMLSSKEFQALEKKLNEDGFDLESISDTGARYRCLCYDFNVVFKNGSTEETITKEVRVQQRRNVTIK